jgi:hypothetical protein
MAMYAELEHLEGNKALSWALSCLAASYRLRASFLAVAIVSARLCVAAAAGLFGLIHVVSSSANLWTKILIMTDSVPEHYRAALIRSIDAQSLGHWFWIFLMFSALGFLHVMAALMMAIGRNDWVLKLAIVVVGFDLVVPFAGMGAFTAPAIYMGLITLMALVSAALAWLWRWDERRMAAA